MLRLHATRTCLTPLKAAPIALLGRARVTIQAFFHAPKGQTGPRVTSFCCQGQPQASAVAVGEERAGNAVEQREAQTGAALDAAQARGLNEMLDGAIT